MSSILGEIGLSEQLVLSYIIGLAGAPAVYPYVRSLENLSWENHAVMPPDAITLAAGVAQGQVDSAQALAWAKQTGFGADQFAALVNIANIGPPLGSALQLLRRGVWTPTQYTTALNRAGIEPQWREGLLQLQQDPLEPAEVAKAIHRNIMPGSGLLLVEPSSTPGKVPIVPPSTLDPTTEAAWSGIDHERLRILVGNAGLPPGVVQGLELLNRGAITEDDFSRLVGESNMRQEWGEVLLQLRRRRLTPHEYAEAELRGVMSPADAQAGASLSGLNGNDYGTLFEILGRPISVKQVTTGLARGGTFGGDYTDVPDGPYRDAIRRSAVRPEYAALDYANRFTYPSGFQIKAEAPTLGQQQTEQILLEVGWSPKWATTFSTAWAGGGTGTSGDPHVTKAQNQHWTALHGSYVKSRTDDATALTHLTTIGVAAGAQQDVLDQWKGERELVRAGLSAAQIKKEYVETRFTLDEAVARLVELGWSVADAQAYLPL